MPISNMSSTEKQKGISSTSASLPGKRQSVHSNSYAIPPAHVVCTFLDGGIGLYDLGRRKWDFLRNYVSSIVSLVNFASEFTVLD